MDTRVRVTKMLIENSFMQLLKTTPLRKITVTKVCEGAQINRITFYKHYQDVFDLYEKMAARLIGRSAEKLKGRLESSDLHAGIRAVFQDIADHADEYALLFSENVENVYRMRSVEAGIGQLAAFDVPVPGIGREDYEALKTFLSAGGAGVLFAWMQEGMRQDPVLVADRLYGLVSRMMRTYAVNL